MWIDWVLFLKLSPKATKLSNKDRVPLYLMIGRDFLINKTRFCNVYTNHQVDLSLTTNFKGFPWRKSYLFYTLYHSLHEHFEHLNDQNNAWLIQSSSHKYNVIVCRIALAREAGTGVACTGSKSQWVLSVLWQWWDQFYKSDSCQNLPLLPVPLICSCQLHQRWEGKIQN